ncbi:261_t:CDS:2 [Diversispora eburnea]|uniref:261_t:CDS:1 n=1 Tax=Diversispora eburnea TaxID=1213867 RepID=A0A9N9FUW3_9GLOM|nr:261_t:CDS:2 [Diversispora eburnea]
MGKNSSIVIPMDGFHYSKKELTNFLLRLPINEDLTINAPSFDHSKGDPEPDDIKVLPSHKIIIIEGLYLHLKTPPMWNPIASHMDDTWFIHVDQEIAKERIIKRHIKTPENEEQAIFRIENNDMINADYILKNSSPPTRIIYSIDDESNMKT